MPTPARPCQNSAANQARNSAMIQVAGKLAFGWRRFQRCDRAFLFSKGFKPPRGLGVRLEVKCLRNRAGPNLENQRRTRQVAGPVSDLVSELASEYDRRSVGGYILLGRVRCPPLGNPIRGQSRVANLVQQRAVADAQRARRLLAVPVTILQNFQNDFPF
jgi:hypothetical protein